MYEKIFKRFLDIILSILCGTILSPIFLILIIVGTIAMKGNPFFMQHRPGKNEKIFNLIKFRTMTNQRDTEGNLLPDADRLNKYGKFLRTTSLDELPELVNIIKGDMAIVGPRPLLVRYLPLYNERQKKRHLVRPGITGYAQVNGRNSINWEDRFELDVDYVENVSFAMDLRIFFKTIKVVLKKDGISSESHATMEDFEGSPDYRGEDN